MKFQVEVNDFWLEEGELTEALQGHIKREVVQQISASIETKVKESITKRLIEAMDAKIAAVIDGAMADFIATGIIKVSGREVAVIDHLKSVFQSNSGWHQNPDKKMAQLAKEFGDECKAQYNNIFAGKIVVEMKNQGFLKDDMAKILLGESA